MSSNNIASQIIGSGQYNAVDNWLMKNKDIYRDLARYANDKGYESNTTGILSAAVEYAMDNRDDDKAQELAKVMGLGKIMTGYENGSVENNLGVNVSDHAAGQRQAVVGKVTRGLPVIQDNINHRETFLKFLELVQNNPAAISYAKSRTNVDAKILMEFFVESDDLKYLNENDIQGFIKTVY